MSQRKTSSDDRLFISAVAAVLVGLALLLRTTGVAESVPILLPFIVTGAGGVLLYLAVVRRFADPFFFTGVMFCLGGVCMIATALLGARFKQAWPCYMVAAGLAWLATGLRGAGRLRAGFAVPAFGFIFLGSLFVLFSAGVIPTVDVPVWVIVISATALSLGTAVGGWRIMRTMGHRVVELEPVHGFAAETTAASVLLVTAHLGMPVSTTHVISSAIMGVGSARGPKGVRWGVARRILLAWVITLPATASVAAVSWLILHTLGFG